MKINEIDKVAVTSRSFSKNKILRDKLLSLFKNVTFNESGDRLFGDNLVSFLEGHTLAITALEVIDEYVISRLPDLKLISKYGVGLDMIDKNALARHNVRLSWTPGVNKLSVAEMVISSAISLLHRIPENHKEFLRGEWHQIMGRQLTGKTIGIVGCGNIGREVVRLLKPYGCKILINDIVDLTDFCQKNDASQCSLFDLFKYSDVITFHVPLNESTKDLLNSKNCMFIKQGACLINYSRGGVVNELVIKKMLIEKYISGAAFDVFDVEPPLDLEFIKIDSMLSTSHIGGSTEEAVIAMGLAAINGLGDIK